MYERIWNGGMPGHRSGRYRDRDVFYSSYIQTYINRDVTDMIPGVDKLLFEELYNGRVPHMAGRRSDKFPRDWKYLPDIKMYDLRHTYCSMLYDADVDVKTAQYLMGHASLEMTLKIYTHLSEQKKQRSYDKLFEYVDVKNDVRESESPDK